MKLLRRCNIIFIVICIITPTIPAITFAECLSDSQGRVICGRGECVRSPMGGVVYCSAYFFGKAIATSAGTVVCSKGKCGVDIQGLIYCSKMEGGGAALNGFGSVVCYGGCEQASADYCEQQPAAR
jgi:hypothetical protein